jgi:hypothetical protein
MKKILGVTAIFVGVLIIICYMLCTPAIAKDVGYSTLPGWSAGYRLYLDMTDFDYYDDDQGKLVLFGKYKQRNGNVVRFGIDGSSDSAVLFFEQEFKF